jgi:hypothetical protein
MAKPSFLLSATHFAKIASGCADYLDNKDFQSNRRLGNLAAG